MLTVLGPISIEAWPSALAPWVLLPLIRGSVGGSARRAAALSAIAVAMVGGVNAAATFAVLPLGAIWILTRTRGPRRTSLMLWWPVFTLLGTLWWLVPLFVMGAYSPPFLDYIETTSVTTFPTTVFDALRGTSDWVPYVSAESRAGNDLLTTAYICLNSGIVLFFGFVGLLDRRHPHRLFLSLSLVVGLLLVTAGHHGSVQGFFSDPLRELLDGLLAPLRNVHKFDVILRLPLVLGLGLVFDRLMGASAASSGGPNLQQQLDRTNRTTAVAMAVLGVVAASAPVFLARIEPSSPVVSVPGYWHDTAGWLARHGQGGTALLAPGTGFGDYLWGSPKDEPLQFLARTPWAVRNAIPLAPAGNIRMLDAIEARFAEGRGSPGMAEFLRRSGIGYLVVRNDLRPGNDVPEPVLVHQAIADSPGLERVATFGPEVGGGGSFFDKGTRTVINGGWQARYPAVEIYAVPGTGTASAGSDPTVVVGGPEDLLDLEDLAVIGREPVVLGSDVTDARDFDPVTTPFVLTDGLRQRERFYARIHDGYSPVLTPGDKPHGMNKHLDYLNPGQHQWLTTGRLVGASSISASSSGSDADAPAGARRGELPYAAVDGSLDTDWVSNPAHEGAEWWRIGLTKPRDLRHVRITGGRDASQGQSLRVRTEHGISKEVDVGPGETATVDVPAGSTRWVRVESPPDSAPLLSLAEVDLGGAGVERQLVLPPTPRRWGNPAAVVLRADLDARRGCVSVDAAVRCAPGKARPSEEAVGIARQFQLSKAGEYEPELLVRPRAGASLDALDHQAAAGEHLLLVGLDVRPAQLSDRGDRRRCSHVVDGRTHGPASNASSQLDRPASPQRHQHLHGPGHGGQRAGEAHPRVARRPSDCRARQTWASQVPRLPFFTAGDSRGQGRDGFEPRLQRTLEQGGRRHPGA